jgi:SAM-dependent methyltransferase
MAQEVDAWGAIFRDQWKGIAARHQIERDDGRIEAFESAVNYYDPPRLSTERDLLDRLEGPVLDLAGGPGSYALYLQTAGRQVVAADFSPAALDVCRARGVRNVVRIDLRAFKAEPGAFRSVIVMGNTLGAHQTPETFPDFLRELRSAVQPRGRLLFSMIDPLDTTDEGHLAYQRRNRARGVPPGLIRIRIRYHDLVEDWMTLWMLTADELEILARDTGWMMVEERRDGPWRIRLLEALEG